MQCYFFKYLLGFLYNLAVFQSNIKEVQEKFPAKFSMFLRAKPRILGLLKLQYDINKIFAHPRLQESQILQNSSEILVNIAFLTRILQVCTRIENFANLLQRRTFLTRF